MEKLRDISEQVDYRLCIRIETGKVSTSDFQFKQNHANTEPIPPTFKGRKRIP